MQLQRQVAVLAVLGSLAAACSILDPTFAEPALIIFYADTAAIAAPDSATRGVPFQVSFPTFAGGCTRSAAHTRLGMSNAVAEIRPYNETRRAAACTDDLIFLTHTVSVRFDQPGSATIRVVAAQRPFQGTLLRTGPAQVERVVYIR